MKPNNFVQRTLTAVFFVAYMLVPPIAGQAFFALALVPVVMVGLLEFKNLLGNIGLRPLNLPYFLAGLSLYVLLSLCATQVIDSRMALLALPILLLPFFVQLWLKQEQALQHIASQVMALLYVPVPLAILVSFVRPYPSSGLEAAGLLFGYFFILWANDTGAYLIGSLIGKHKLFERISPKKTWEGTLGGMGLALLVAWADFFMFGRLSLWQWLLVGGVTVLTATPADLVESMFKRQAGIKDSGSILPGHGGVLDRYDAILLSSPFVFVLLYCFL